MENWNKITQHLYTNIQPEKGSLYTCIIDNNSENYLGCSWIELEMNGFDYLDPFYGEQKSNSNFKTQIELEYAKFPKIYALKDLENLTFENSKDIFGSFSNSIDITVSNMKFGKINDGKIECEMEYSLSNSDSYGMMDGTKEEHLSSSAIIRLNLDIKEPILFIDKSEDITEYSKKLNKELFEIDEISSVINPTSSSDNLNQYNVPLKKNLC
ncbi:Hypothetical protein I595_3719 [Croceitalea dokdonensis DOKDO 023]|uniref:Uncharacterized protein n=1 Tax=Croceitalea dokdonensis DOKDO 023 TaxID=1300341 RepID=A0A0P7A1A3_9FLAO|nr:hypothetical protein [Croceitalea dokdonensis]KPM30181.1 Hypothetical protein I595_3719 [Croceitalea dokdonensis DOKDO 023]